MGGTYGRIRGAYMGHSYYANRTYPKRAPSGIVRPTLEEGSWRGDNTMKHLLGVLAAALLATAVGLGITGVAPQEAAAAGGYVKTCGGGNIYLNDDEKRTVELHNRARAQHGLVPFCVHPTLVAAARFHSQEMLDKGYAAHESYDGEPVGERLLRFGYDWVFHGENIAWGLGEVSYRSPEHVFEFWMNSPSHRPNILSGDLEEVGVGTAYGRHEGYEAATYTVDFGAR